jgi:multidrug efflux pump
LGNSSGSRASLGIVVVGGLVFAGILTLFVIPAVYSFLSRKGKPVLNEQNGMTVSPAASSLQPKTVLS